MKIMATGALTAGLIVLGVAAAAGTAQGGNSVAIWNAQMSQACAAQGGRFEQSWIYNDQGTQWGEVLSCTTGTGFISCQGETCRSARWVGADTGQTRRGKGFPAEPAAFTQALSVLANE